MACEHCQRLGSDGAWHRNVRVHSDPDSKDAHRKALEINATALYTEQLELLLSKNRDYSPRNISDAGFPDVMSGLTTRIGDKYFRIRNLLELRSLALHESMEDSFLDLANYAMIAALCLRGQWPGVSEGGKRA